QKQKAHGQRACIPQTTMSTQHGEKTSWQRQIGTQKQPARRQIPGERTEEQQ
ncbi:hypothetical protein JRQ81_013195, partial [Phrynocephalus forsythii]